MSVSARTEVTHAPPSLPSPSTADLRSPPSASSTDPVVTPSSASTSTASKSKGKPTVTHPPTTTPPSSTSSSPPSSSSPASSDAAHHSTIKLHLASIPFLSEIDESKLLHLASFFEWKRCDAGDVICRQGDEANGFSIIVTGTVSVSATGPGGGQIPLNTLHDGDWFGEIALTQNTLRTATLTSLTPCVLLYLSSSRFNTFLLFAPELRQGLFSSIISRRTANSLKAVPLFAPLSKPGPGGRVYDESKLQLLGEMFRFQTFSSKGEVVFKEGDEADAFYIIQRGTVGVWARKGDNDEEMMQQSRRGRRSGRRRRRRQRRLARRRLRLQLRLGPLPVPRPGRAGVVGVAASAVVHGDHHVLVVTVVVVPWAVPDRSDQERLVR